MGGGGGGGGSQGLRISIKAYVTDIICRGWRLSRSILCLFEGDLEPWGSLV